MSGRDEAVKKSVQLLKQGARMLSLQCPICGSPLFQLKNGDIVCPIHGKIHVVSDESEVVESVSRDVLGVVMEKVLDKIRRMSSRIGEERNAGEEAVFAQAFLNWLNVLEKIMDIRGRKGKSSVKEEKGAG